MTKPTANAASVPIVKPAKRPASCPFAKARQTGWEDVRAGRAPDYHVIDALPRKEAYAYERGRQQATLAKVAAGRRTLPAWPDHVTFPELVHSFLGRARAKALMDETATGRSRQKTVKSQRPRPPAIPIQGAPREPSPAMLAAAIRRRRRTGDGLRDIQSGHRNVHEIEGRAARRRRRPRDAEEEALYLESLQD